MWRPPDSAFQGRSSFTKVLRRISASSINGTRAAMRSIAIRETGHFKTSVTSRVEMGAVLVFGLLGL